MRYVFGANVLDLESRELWRDNRLIPTRRKVFDLLSYLLRRPNHMITKDDLLEIVWDGRVVSEATVASCILAVRQAIGDDGQRQNILKTVRGQGYRFVAEVAVEEAENISRADVVEPDAGHISPAPKYGGIPAIAVLPFNNLGASGAEDYMVDGLTEDIITELSRFKGLAVIARNSSFQFKDVPVDVRSIGAELQVDYVLEGSIRAVAKQCRTSAQLIYAPTAQHLWAEHFDTATSEIIGLHDEITQYIVASIVPEIGRTEIRISEKPQVENLRSYEMAWRARGLLERSRAEGKPELFRQGMVLAEEAAQLDPHCSNAWWEICFANFLLAFSRPDEDTSALLKRAREAASRVGVLDRGDNRSHLGHGWISFIERDFDGALPELKTAHQINPNCTLTLALMGVVETACGDPTRGAELQHRAIRLSPRDPWSGFMYGALGFANFALGDYAAAIGFVRQAIRHSPSAPANHIVLAACLAEAGDLDGAADAIRAQRKFRSNILEEYIAGRRLPFKDETLARRYSSALSRAAAVADAS